ncbi:hypothetical protein PPERSA_05908 [Pseudocohnilembus persalinus]|uniref:Inosine triphosphate pyrophosphatase n=1 Tax=Pseudocohnilembus persalinus TaxID=266149 RepID=A0A0V0R435_PSEPJ|nr:hypothetical protein PPERSA_05908 [Pseudocohnilembus persalinus]|eukprot:KRX09239.1 hypothetical protein PPERSA_05908 [Pseudocohnilembus persalinus]
MQGSKQVITLVTGNKNKLAEFQKLLGEAVTNQAVDLPELQGEPEDIAKEKCRLAFKQIGKPVITEDTSLCFNAHKGLPGPYIKWYLDKLGPQGLSEMLDSYQDKTGYAQCIIAYMKQEFSEPLVFVGKVDGSIVRPRQKEGEKAFGWDPIFEPKESNGKTFAEMEKSEKNLISHRGRAVEKLVQYLKEQGQL